MTGPRDLSGVWDAAYAVAYVGYCVEEVRAFGLPLAEKQRDDAARVAASVADEAVAALHAVRGSEGA